MSDDGFPDPFGGTPQPGFSPVDTPVGAVIAFAGVLGSPIPGTASPPDSMSDGPKSYVTEAVESRGWMLCDGRSLDIGAFPELFAVLGQRYGGSDGRFCLPDYRGYFLRAHDAGAGQDPDARTDPAGGDGGDTGVGSRQDFALQTHEHVYTKKSSNAVPSKSGSPAAQSAESALTEEGPTDSLESPPGNVKVSQHETRPKNISVNYLIKFTYGTWPPPGHF